MLLGLPTAGSYARFSDSYADALDLLGVFVHDDWKVNVRLTFEPWTALGTGRFAHGALQPLRPRLRLGLRNSPLDEAARSAYAKNPISEVSAANFASRGGLTYRWSGWASARLYTTPQEQFHAAHGFAYRLGNSGNNGDPMAATDLLRFSRSTCAAT